MRSTPVVRRTLICSAPFWAKRSLARSSSAIQNGCAGAEASSEFCTATICCGGPWTTCLVAVAAVVAAAVVVAVAVAVVGRAVVEEPAC